MGVEQTKLEIIEEHINGVGGVTALKTLACVIGHRFIGDRIISIKKEIRKKEILFKNVDL